MNYVEPIRGKNNIVAMTRFIYKESSQFPSIRFRNSMIWQLGITSGLRVSDILGLNICDVLGKKKITVTEKKTGKLKSFPINDVLNKDLQEFCKLRLKDSKDINAPLFIGYKHERLDRSQVYRFLNDACKKIGLTGVNVGTHTMRKTFGYHHYKQFKDVAMLQNILNHSSPAITLRYIGIMQDDIDTSYAKFNILNTRIETNYDSDKSYSYTMDNLSETNNKNARLIEKLQEEIHRLQKQNVALQRKREVKSELKNIAFNKIHDYLENGGTKHREFCEFLLSGDM